MKADINESGRLTITAETPLESYALKKWFESYNTPDGNSTLNIEPLRARDDSAIFDPRTREHWRKA